MEPIQRLSQTEHIKSMDEKETLETVKAGFPYRSDMFALILLLEGEIQLKANLSPFTASGGSLVFVNTNKVYEFISISNNFKMLGISFTGDFLGETGIHLGSPEVLESFSSSFHPCFPLEEKEKENIYILLSFLADKLRASGEQLYRQEVIQHAFATLLYEVASVYRRFSDRQEVKLTRKEEITLHFLKLISTHFRAERSVQFYADALFISARHLTQVIKEVTGKTAGEMIEDAVILEAKVLLSNPNHNIAKVTSMLNFSSPSFFSKFFKTRTGMSPSECRVNL